MSESKVVAKLRLCPVQNKKVVCDGFCNVVFDDGTVHICSVREKALDVALNVDVGKFVVSECRVVVFKCPLVDASSVVETVFRDGDYRSLSVGFVGYNEADLPMVEIVVEFAVR